MNYNPLSRRQYYLSHKAENNAYSKKWAKEHRERVNIYQRKWAKQNKEKVKLAHKKWADKNPDYLHYWAARYHFGLTRVEYDRMYQIQEGACAICRKHQTEFKKRLAIDHNHKTGRVRGLLCDACNHLIANAKENTCILQATIQYLLKHQKEEHHVNLQTNDA